MSTRPTLGRCGAIVALTAMIALPTLAADLLVGPGQTFTTIQAAVDAAAASGDTILVDPGTYNEQVTVDGKELAIIGAGASVTMVTCPASLTSFYNDGATDHYAVVGVQLGTLHLSALSVDGLSNPAAVTPFGAVAYGEAAGSLDAVTVQHADTGVALLGSNVAVTGNTIIGDLERDDPTALVGLSVTNLEGAADLDLLATGNTFAGLGTAMLLRDTAPTVGVWLSATVTGNTINTCAVGLDSDLGITALAEDCWWSALDGPGGDGPGAGAELLGLADVDPWRTDVLNLVNQPAALALDELNTTGNVVFAYTGGASARLYGFSIDVTWDPAVLQADASSFTRAATGPFAGADYFITQDVAAGQVRIDLALGSFVPGAYSGPLFQADFALEPTATDEATSAITATVLSARDNQNHPLAGLVPEAGQGTVDSSPILAAVLVTDTTLDSTDWTRDTHDLSISVTLHESSLDSLRCDLAAFGGPVLELADAMVEGNVYTWTHAAITGTGDGDVSALVTAVDTQAAQATADDAITADNTPPATLGGLVVTPGHHKVHLAWTEPTPDAGSPLAGVDFRYTTWGNYPAYTGVLPDPPADILSGSDTGLGLLPGDATTWTVAARDVYVLAGFVVDFVGNASPLGDSGAATNYWLGDANDDGVVDVFDDLTALGDSYGKATGEPGYDPVCDVGPTLDWSPRGIPDPQADGYQVQFEDLMVTALNHDEVTPEDKSIPVAPELRWERQDPRTWVLTLLEPCPRLKGLNLRGALPDGVTCQVAAGAALQQQSAPVFVRNIASRGLDTGVAVMGPGAVIDGIGELLRVVTDRPLAALDVTLSARDLSNRELLAGGQTTDVETPSSHGLLQNMPNPFNPRTTIQFALPQSEAVQLAVYGLDGRLVRTLVDEVRPAGRHAVIWDGRDQSGRTVATGLYLYRLQAGDFRQVRKMTLMK